MKLSLLLIGIPLLLLSSALILNRSFKAKAAAPTVLAAEVSLTLTDIPYTLDYDIQSGDARPYIIRNYLHYHHSPLEFYTDKIISISDKYHLDFRLLVAIARQESNLCKVIPDNSYNCWGYGIYGDKITRFDSYEEGLDTVAKTLKRQYIDKGLVTPDQIMAKYTPPSLEKGGSWAKGVNEFLSELE